MTQGQTTWVLFALGFLIPAIGNAQTVEEIFDGMARAENAGLQGIDNFLIKTEMMGFNVVEYFEKAGELSLENGDTAYVMRLVPIDELQERMSPDNPMTRATPGDLEHAATVIEQQGGVMEQELLKEMAKSGVGTLGGGMLGNLLMHPPANQPWLSANPRDMTSMYATVLRAGAKRKMQRLAEDPMGDAQDMLNDVQELKAQTSVVGEQQIDGRRAIGLAATDLDHKQVANGEEFTLNTVTMWVDAEKQVPLRLNMDGVMMEGGKPREITISRNDEDYRSVPGCGSMYKPFRSVMRIGGVLTPEEEAQLAEAQVQMAELEQQLAQMPQAQQDMIMRQMGPQMEMMRKMVESGGIEIETKITSLTCNQGVPDVLELVKSTYNF
jgi:hypothetical protein